MVQTAIFDTNIKTQRTKKCIIPKKLQKSNTQKNQRKFIRMVPNYQKQNHNTNLHIKFSYDATLIVKKHPKYTIQKTKKHHNTQKFKHHIQKHPTNNISKKTKTMHPLA